MNARVVALVVAAAVAWPALIALRQVDGVLAAMHPPRDQSYRAASVTDFGLHLPEAGHVTNALDTWASASTRHQLGDSLDPFHGQRFAVHWYLQLDVLFIAAYVLLLLMAVSLIREKLPPLDVPGDPAEAVRRDWFRKLLGHAPALVCALGVTDLVEDAVSWAVARWKPGHGGVEQGVHPWLVWVWGGWAASWLKVALALIVLVLIALALLEIWRAADSAASRGVAQTVRVVRAHLLVLALFALALVGPIASEQVADVIRRWPGDGWSASLAVLLTIWFATVLFASARSLIAATAIDERSSRRNRQPGERYAGERRPRPPLGAVFAAGAVLVVAGVGLEALLGSGLGLVIPGAILVLLAFLSWRVRGFPMRRRRDLVLGGTRAVPALLLALPPVFLGLAIVGSSIDEVVYAQHGPFKGLILKGLLLQGVGWILFVFGYRLPDPNLETDGAEYLGPGAPDPLVSNALAAQAKTRIALILSSVAAVGAVLWIWWQPFRLPDAIGLVGALSLFLVCLTLLVHGASGFSNGVDPLEVFRVVRLSRTPVVTLVVIWAIVAGLIAKPGYEDARVVSRDGAKSWTLTQAWTRWKNTQPASDSHFATPVLFVVTSGGGIRAGYWTDIALRCVLEGEPQFVRGADSRPSACAIPGGDAATDRARLFVASGISGGSVGLADYAAHVLDGEAATSEWPTTHWARDDGAPAFSWLLFGDIPSAFVLRKGGTDRAEILERSWEKTWHSEGLDHGLRESWSLRTKETPVPLLVLNGTRVQDGCRFVVSPLALSIRPQAGGPVDCRALEPFEAATPSKTPVAERKDWTFATSQDVADFLCPGKDVRLSTAGLLSARFPIISDSGRLEQPTKHCGSTVDPANVVDGGYFDTSGASPVVEIMGTLDKLVAKDRKPGGPCYVPVLLQLDNSYAGGAAAAKGNRPWESLAPALTLKGARDARESNARQDAALLFSRQQAFGSDWPGLDRYAHVYPRAHPGSSAPLGWTLSAATRDDLRNELLSEENRAEIQKVRGWLKPDAIACPGPPG